MASPLNGLRDENGRHVIPRGFVVVTSYRGIDIDFDAEDYHRMVRLGANSQVIRLELGKLSTFDGGSVDQSLGTLPKRALSFRIRPLK